MGDLGFLKFIGKIKKKPKMQQYLERLKEVDEHFDKDFAQNKCLLLNCSFSDLFAAFKIDRLLADMIFVTVDYRKWKADRIDQVVSLSLLKRHQILEKHRTSMWS